MEKLIRILSLSIALFVVSSCTPISLISYKSNLETPKGYTEYINYYLPKAYLKIKVPVEKKGFNEGLIHQIKDPVLKSEIESKLLVNFGWKPVSEPEKKFTIGEKIQFIPQTVPDVNKHFTIAYKHVKVFSQSLNIKLNKDGIISSGEFAQENKTFEFVSKGLELGASLISKFFTLGTMDYQVKSTDFYSKKEDTDAFERILILTEELHTLVFAKANILTQNAGGVSKEAIEFRVKALDQRIAEIKGEILGGEKKTVYWISFLYEPRNPIDTLLEIDHLHGISIPKRETNLPSQINDGEIAETKVLTISAVKDSPVIVVSPSTRKKLTTNPSDTSGFLRYNLPAKFNLKLFWDGKPLKSFNSSEDKKGIDLYSMYFPQFGKVGVLPGDFADASIVYYEDIGAIKEVNFSRTAAADAEAMQSAFTVAESIMTLRSAIQEYQKAKKEAETDTEEEETEETEETIIKLFIEDSNKPNENF